jgi:hypothetical protein
MGDFVDKKQIDKIMNDGSFGFGTDPCTIDRINLLNCKINKILDNLKNNDIDKDALIKKTVDDLEEMRNDIHGIVAQSGRDDIKPVVPLTLPSLNLKSKPISPSIKKNEGWTNFPIGPGIDYDNNHFC